MDQYQVTGGYYIGIDKVSIGIPFKPVVPEELVPELKLVLHNEIMKEAQAQIFHIQSTLEEIWGSSGKPLKGMSMLKRHYVFSGSDGNKLIAAVLVGRNPNGMPVLNIDFNPSKMQFEDWKEVESLLDILLFGGYHELYTYGVVSHFEFFMDLGDVAANDLVLISFSRRSVTQVRNTTQYRGKRGSKLVGTVYDKAKVAKIPGVLTRIEVRLNRRDLSFRELVETDIPNPMEHFAVVPNKAMEAISAEWNMPHLGSQIKNLGLFDGVANKYARNAIGKRLQEYAIPEWQTDSLWKTYKAMLMEFQPSSIGGFLPQYAPLHYGLFKAQHKMGAGG